MNESQETLVERQRCLDIVQAHIEIADGVPACQTMLTAIKNAIRNPHDESPKLKIKKCDD